MAKRSIPHLLILLSFAIGLSLAGCHPPVKAAEKFGFKDEKAIRGALEGSWILQEYADSIDAGLTPKLLEYMFDREYEIKYDPAMPKYVNLYYKKSNDKLVVQFDYKMNKVFFISEDSTDTPADSTRRKGQVASAELMSNGADTMLLFYNDSTPDRPQTFIKYDMNKCSNVASYTHLVSSKFLVGKYYEANDIEKLHHIILTKCQSVEGGESISPAILGHLYEVQLDQFGAEGDRVRFYDTQGGEGTDMYWTVDKDSLMLTPVLSRRAAKTIVLLRK